MTKFIRADLAEKAVDKVAEASFPIRLKRSTKQWRSLK
jgi:hypothetical protein